MTRARTTFRSLAMPVVLAFKVAASVAQPASIPAYVGAAAYDVPAALLDWHVPAPLPEREDGGFALLATWPDFAPPPAGALTYEDGVIAVVVQVTQPSFAPKNAALHQRFLDLWLESTKDQFGIEVLRLEDVHVEDTEAARRLGLLGLAARAPSRLVRGSSLFADAPLEQAAQVMMCGAETACQLWWLQDGNSVEVTFARQLLASWQAVQAKTSGLIEGMRRRSP